MGQQLRRISFVVVLCFSIYLLIPLSLLSLDSFLTRDCDPFHTLFVYPSLFFIDLRLYSVLYTLKQWVKVHPKLDHSRVHRRVTLSSASKMPNWSMHPRRAYPNYGPRWLSITTPYIAPVRTARSIRTKMYASSPEDERA